MLIREHISRHLRDTGSLPTQREVLRATGGKAAIVSETLRSIRESGIIDDDVSAERPGTRRLKREQRLQMVTRFVQQHMEDHGRLPTQRRVLSAAGGSARMAQQVLLHYRNQAVERAGQGAASGNGEDSLALATDGWRNQRMSRAQRESLVRRYIDGCLRRDRRLPTQRDVLKNVGGGASIVQGVLATYRRRDEEGDEELTRSLNAKTPLGGGV